jgi:hypothetical protein
VSGCSDTTCRTLLIGSVGLAELAGMQFAVFPNPSKSMLTISFNETAAGKNWSLILSDPDGRILNRQSFTRDQPLRQLEFNLAPYARGIYLLTLQGESATMVKKIIKD